MKQKNNVEPILSWIMAMILCPLGVSMSVKSDFGVSMIEAPVYVIYLKISSFFKWFTYGMSEYLLQGILLVVMCLVIRKFKWSYLLSFVTAFIFGWIVDGWNFLFSYIPADTMTARIIFGVLGCIITSFSVSMFFRTWLPLEVWELFVSEFSKCFNFKIDKVKWVYDIGSLIFGILLMLIFFGEFRFEAIGIGTLITTLINAPLIGFFTKILDKFWYNRNKNNIEIK